MDWHELEKMKVTDLREMAKEKLGLEGVTALHKDQLVEALAKEMGIVKPHKVAVGGEKTKIKQEIRALKAQRAEALNNHDHDALHQTRHEIHKLKRKLRRMARLQG
jgi:protein-arginine kinase activator protein McsA